jgi:hypothetical protein
MEASVRPNDRRWLQRECYAANVVASRVANAIRIKKVYGDLDEQFDVDGLKGPVNAFRYTTLDERSRCDNPPRLALRRVQISEPESPPAKARSLSARNSAWRPASRHRLRSWPGSRRGDT